MKSQEIKLTNNLSCAVEALQMVETTSAEAGLNREQTNILRLLTEELISMTTDILKTCQGTMWVEYEHGDCALHLNAMAPMEENAKEAFIAASREKINAPIRGLKNKISALFAGLLIYHEFPDYYMAEAGASQAAFPWLRPLSGSLPQCGLCPNMKRGTHERKNLQKWKAWRSRSC